MTTEFVAPALADSLTDAATEPSVVTLYTTGSACVQCALTQKVLTDRGIRFTALDITLFENKAARDYVIDDLGYTQAPVVVVDDWDHWSGFQVDQINRIAIRLGGRQAG